MLKRAFLAALTGLILAGCSTVGPRSVPRDRFDYNTAIADSWKQQTLLNIVRLRYADMPLFVEVASVVSGYTLEGAVSLDGTVSSGTSGPGDFLALGTSGRYTDRPTITYAPITGEKFNQSFMTPIPPKAILFLMQSQWPAEMILPITLNAINGLRAHTGAGKYRRPGDPDFYRVIALLQQIQASGAVGMRVVQGADEKETTLMFFYREHLPPAIGTALDELERVLSLANGIRELKVSYGNVPETNREIALQTRSMLQIMIALAAEIEVPAAHITEGLTLAGRTPAGSEAAKEGRLIRIHAAAEKPVGAFVAVRYLDHWFWIDNRDFLSKRTFTFLMVLFSLTESGGKGGLPLVTIPAG
jgi:predicted small lipoprotein YifL